MRTLLTVLFLCACGDDNLAGVGQPCNSSGDCAAGLLCDFSKKAHVCEPAGAGHPPDLSMPIQNGEDLASANHD
jgi:hypothetical protein